MARKVLASIAGMYWQMIKAAGFDPLPLFRIAGIEPGWIQDPNKRIPEESIVRLIKETVALTNDPSIWLRIEDVWHPSHLGALGYAWLASPTLRDALMRLRKYRKIIADFFPVNYEEDESGFMVRFDYPDNELALYGRDASTVMTFITICRANCGMNFRPLQVDLAQPEPDNISVYEHRYGCPVKFNQPVTRVLLSHEDINRPLTTSNQELANLSDQVMIRYLADLDGDDIVSRVSAEIIRRLPNGPVTESVVASGLYLNVRTLQRKLQQEGVSFKHLVDEIRRELADAYIHDEKRSLAEISFLLGFSETSSFSRAYKRWTGRSPSSVRKQISDSS